MIYLWGVGAVDLTPVVRAVDLPSVGHVETSKSKKCLFIVDKNTTKTLVADTIKST